MRQVEGFSLKDFFGSEEDKALAYFGLGDTKQLTSAGRAEFTDFIFTEGGDKTGFLAKVKEAYEKATKKKK
jgi:hypothetical protein